MKRSTRFLSFVIAAIMVLGVMPLSALVKMCIWE
jgi:hypothetical protein